MNSTNSQTKKTVIIKANQPYKRNIRVIADPKQQSYSSNSLRKYFFIFFQIYENMCSSF